MAMQNSRLAIAAAFVFALTSGFTADALAAIAWQPNLETAQRVAAQSNRLVLVHFWGPSCKPCMQLEKNVFSQDEVAKALEPNFVFVKLNVDEAPGTAKLFGVSRWPTDVLITATGQPVTQLQSPPTAKQYIAQMNQYAQGYRQLQERAIAEHGVGAYDGGYAAAGQQPAAQQSAARQVAAQQVAAQADAQATVDPNDRYAGHATTEAAPIPPADGRYVAAYPPPISPVAQAAQRAQANQADKQPTAEDRYAQADNRYNNDPYAQGDNRYAQAPALAPAANTAAASNAVLPMNSAVAAPAGVPSAAAVVDPNVRPASAPRYTQQAWQQQQGPPQVQSGAPAGPPAAAAAPTLGIDGYCPVRLLSQRSWVKGDKRYGAVHRGRVYLFAGPKEQQDFLASPDAYSPVISGDDPVAAIDGRQAVAGRRDFGLFYGNHYYLFSSEQSMLQFSKNPGRYANEALQAMTATGAVRR